MNPNKHTKQDKKINPEDSFVKWWQRHKTLIAILSVFISFTVGFNLFLYQWVITPMAEKRVLDAEIEFVKNAKDIKEYYEAQIKDLKNIIDNKENELQSLRIKLSELQNQGVDQREIDLLIQEIALKEKEIKFYRDQIAYLKDQLTKAKKLIESSQKSKVVSETAKIDSAENKAIDKTVSDVLVQEPAKQIILRNQPISLNEDDVKVMLKKYDFYCKELDWNKDYSNSTGQGFNHQYVLQEINGDKVVFDELTGLMWQKGASGNWMNFEDANKWIKEINKKSYAGYFDWRLPTLEEAMSLVESEPKHDNSYIGAIFDSGTRWIWTSDHYQGAELQQWIVYFYYGGCCGGSTLDYCGSVRAVRSVQPSQN